MKLTSLEDLYLEELKELLGAENYIVKALPRMAKAASAPELRSAFENHLKETKEQVDRLEQIFDTLGQKSKGGATAAIKGLIGEGEDWMAQDADPSVTDAGLIAAAQKIEHYEIALYGCARTHAKELGYKKAADLLEKTLSEEENADRKLTALATGRLNAAAAAGVPARLREQRQALERASEGGHGASLFLLGLGVGLGSFLLFGQKPWQETGEIEAEPASKL